MCNFRRKKEKKENWKERKERRTTDSKEERKKKAGSVARYVTAKLNHFLVASSSINVSEDVG
jgi:hypothetical protein